MSELEQLMARMTVAVEGIQQELIAKRHRRERLRKKPTAAEIKAEQERQIDIFGVSAMPSRVEQDAIRHDATPQAEAARKIPVLEDTQAARSIFGDLPPVREGEVQKEPVAGARAVLKSFPNRTAVEQVCPHCDGAIPAGSIHKHEVWE